MELVMFQHDTEEVLMLELSHEKYSCNYFVTLTINTLLYLLFL